jgi:oligoribonuclease (3'-5' exoribonuclease)
MKLNPYLSIDLETTGLNLDHSRVLQIAAVWETWDRPVEELQTFTCFVDNGPILYGEPYALWMNAWILEKIAKRRPEDKSVLPVAEARAEFSRFVRQLNNNRMITIAGKCVAGFDVQILRNQDFDVELFKHRVLDPGAMYAPDYGYVPSLDEINKSLGRSSVTHDAVDDARDVIFAIRKKFEGHF